MSCPTWDATTEFYGLEYLWVKHGETPWEGYAEKPSLKMVYLTKKTQILKNGEIPIEKSPQLFRKPSFDGPFPFWGCFTALDHWKNPRAPWTGMDRLELVEPRRWFSPVNWRCASLDMAFVASTVAPIGGWDHGTILEHWLEWIDIVFFLEGCWIQKLHENYQCFISLEWKSQIPVNALQLFEGGFCLIFFHFFESRKLVVIGLQENNGLPSQSRFCTYHHRLCLPWYH